MQSPILCQRNRFCQIRYFPLAFSNSLCFYITVQKLCLLMMFIHIKYMVSRGFHHLCSFCKKNRLQNIYHLSQVCHFNSIAVLVKDIQCDSRHQSIAHSILLIEKAGICTRLTGIPGSPFIYNHTNLFFRIIGIHNRSMALNQLFHI